MPEGQFRGDKPAPRPRNALPAGDVARRVQGSRSTGEERGLGRGGEQTGAPRGTRLSGQGAVYAPGDPDSRWPCGLAGAPRSPQGLAAGPGTRFIPAGIWPAVPGPLASAAGLCPVLHRAAHVPPFSRCIPNSEVPGAVPLPALAGDLGKVKAQLRAGTSTGMATPKPSSARANPRCFPVPLPPVQGSTGIERTGLSPAWRGARGDRESGAMSPDGAAGSVQGWQCQREPLQRNDALEWRQLPAAPACASSLGTSRASRRCCHPMCCRVLEAQLPAPPRLYPELEKPHCSSCPGRV